MVNKVGRLGFDGPMRQVWQQLNSLNLQQRLAGQPKQYPPRIFQLSQNITVYLIRS